MIDGPVKHNLGQSLKSTFVSMSRKAGTGNRKQRDMRTGVEWSSSKTGTKSQELISPFL